MILQKIFFPLLFAYFGYKFLLFQVETIQSYKEARRQKKVDKND